MLVLDEGSSAWQLLNVQPNGLVRAVIVGIRRRDRPAGRATTRSLKRGRRPRDDLPSSSFGRRSSRSAGSAPARLLSGLRRQRQRAASTATVFWSHPAVSARPFVRRPARHGQLGRQSDRAGPYGTAARPKPSSEILLHLEGQRPDVQSVIHAHPPLAIALSIAGISPALAAFSPTLSFTSAVFLDDGLTAASGVKAISDLIKLYLRVDSPNARQCDSRPDDHGRVL